MQSTQNINVIFYFFWCCLRTLEGILQCKCISGPATFQVLSTRLRRGVAPLHSAGLRTWGNLGGWPKPDSGSRGDISYFPQTQNPVAEAEARSLSGGSLHMTTGGLQFLQQVHGTDRHEGHWANPHMGSLIHGMRATK